MNALKLITLVLGFSFACTLGCSSNAGPKGGTGGSTFVPLGTGGSGLGGQGGAPSVDATADAPIDAAASDVPGPGIDTAPHEAGSAAPFVDCTGLTKDQCHDLIINPPVLPDGVLPLDPGPPPSLPYPRCTAT